MKRRRPKTIAPVRMGDGIAARPVFSEELRSLALQFSGREVRLGEILEATRGRGFFLVLVFISLPFLTPIPLPGFSIPFGLVAAFIGARLAMGRKPWVPRKILARPLPPQSLQRTLNAASRLVRVLEYLLRPRLVFLQDWQVFRRVAGALIMICGLLLVLPLPLPFSNSLPALTVLLLAAGSLERDGAFFLAGCLVFLLCAAYFVFLALGGARLWDKLL